MIQERFAKSIYYLNCFI